MAKEPIRPNPDELLAKIQVKEQRQTRGKLKIFLGYAAGVGKTYAMLEAAQQRKTENVDVIVGYVETHGRAETEAVLAGLELIPRRTLDYRGTRLTEMDTDAILARRPQLAMVDELAHTNAPGTRHTKRYQDVEELLSAGIDVYSTLNIQHLESLNDVVAQITGVTVRETLPDTILEEVDSIELVDLPPEELIQRLKDGKVYVPDQAARAIQKFFRTGNLTALREMALRQTAVRVDDQMREYKRTHAIFRPWAASDRLLVCIGPNPLSERLVRTGRRLADQLDAEWFVIYIETPGHAQLSEAARDRIARTMRLAEELGARTVMLPGNSIPDTLLSYAHSHNITKIVAGKPLRPRWIEWLRGSIMDKIILESGDIDIYIISAETKTATPATAVSSRINRPWKRYLASVALVILISIISQPIRLVLAPANMVMLYLLAVVVAATRWGRGPSLVTAILSVLAFDFFFVPPHLTFVVSDAQYILTFAGLFIVGLIISTLTVRSREQAESAQRRELETAALYALSRDLAATVGLDPILEITVKHISSSFSCETVILLPKGSVLIVGAGTDGFSIDQDKLAVASWVFQRGQPAGRGTDTLTAAGARYLPLKTAQSVVGVLGVQLPGTSKLLSPEQRRLLEAFASQCALAIESAQLAETAQQTQLLHETEKLQTALLNSISHDLRTPLASITGALSSLREDASMLDFAARQDLIGTAWEEADRLNRLVGNLLNMTRLEAGALRLSREVCDVQDIVGVALEQVANRLRSRQVNVDVPGQLSVPADLVLMAQALVNVIDNAVKYSPQTAPIEIRARAVETQVTIEVIDQGIGVPLDDLTRMFEKFYRVQRVDDKGGTGLGLSISKGIVEAHGGRIWASIRPEGGLIVTLALPAALSEVRP